MSWLCLLMILLGTECIEAPLPPLPPSPRDTPSVSVKLVRNPTQPARELPRQREEPLKATYALSEVLVRMDRSPGCGCYGPRPSYSVSVRGTGEVEYRGTGFLKGVRTRTIALDDVVKLVDEFFRARFLDARDQYNFTPRAIRDGEGLAVRWRGGASGATIDLTLQLSDRKKSVRLSMDYPSELEHLAQLLDKIGGPEVWLAR